MRKDTYNFLVTFLLVAVMLFGGTFVYGQKATAQQPIKETVKNISDGAKVILKLEYEEEDMDDEEEGDDSRSAVSQNTSVNIAPAPKPTVSTTAPATIAPTPAPATTITPITSRTSRAS